MLKVIDKNGKEYCISEYELIRKANAHYRDTFINVRIVVEFWGMNDAETSEILNAAEHDEFETFNIVSENVNAPSISIPVSGMNYIEHDITHVIGSDGIRKYALILCFSTTSTTIKVSC